MAKVELHKLYKEETGEPYLQVEYAMNEVRDDNEWNSLTIEAYIEWLENKVTESAKEKDEAIYLHNYKEDYEDAKYQIGQLEDQLENAEDEINELKGRN
jgi:predicted  nucleic acid-binding Zn-ribbon protein